MKLDSFWGCLIWPCAFPFGILAGVIAGALLSLVVFVTEAIGLAVFVTWSFCSWMPPYWSHRWSSWEWSLPPLDATETVTQIKNAVAQQAKGRNAS